MEAIQNSSAPQDSNFTGKSQNSPVMIIAHKLRGTTSTMELRNSPLKTEGYHDLR